LSDAFSEPSDGEDREEGLSEALRWITGLLDDLAIPYQAVGGIAAHAHGATRPLVDIDLYVPDEDALRAVARAAADHLTARPAHHSDEHWDLTLLKLRRSGWTVEVAAAATAKVWDRHHRVWTPAAIDFGRGEEREVGGVMLRVMSRQQLIDYKGGLGRAVDRLDVEELLSR